MRKTYVTSMPNHIGAFLKASKCFANLGINITRVSYNKAVDSHMLFIDAEGTKEQLKKADDELLKIGYLQSDRSHTSIILVEFCLRDVCGSVTRVLELIDAFKFNISYISSQENGTDYQMFKMGLYVDDSARIKEFLKEAQKLCRVRVIDYSGSEKSYDNSIFYDSYVSALSEMMQLSDDVREKLLVNVNLAMQTLDERGLSPQRTFESINKFAQLLSISRGEGFLPRVTEHKITENTTITLIEPPCGSNTMIVKSLGNVLFIDSGYACYKEEMEKIFVKIIPGFENMKKTVLVTHADVDHCGLIWMFDEILASRKTAQCLENEYNARNGYREENPLHKPYIAICKMLTSYNPPQPGKIKPMWGDMKELSDPIEKTGTFDFGELHFDVYEGMGGHLKGEIILIDSNLHIAVTGDVYINVHGLTPQQAEYNRYAPILMTSVDTLPRLCAAERAAVIKKLGGGRWQIFGAHGYKKDYNSDDK